MNLLSIDGEVFYYPAIFSKTESNLLFTTLQESIPWKQEPIMMFGKQIMQPRLQAWYGDKLYKYSGLMMTPLPWTEELLMIKKRIEEASGIEFNSALVNLYRDGKDSMGWHRDNEKELGKDPVIASVSLGSERTFHLRHKENKSLKHGLRLQHGSLLLMKGSTQHFWEHSIPKTKEEIGPRINLTFRMLR